jgi:hypothetical protein
LLEATHREVAAVRGIKLARRPAQRKHLQATERCLWVIVFVRSAEQLNRADLVRQQAVLRTDVDGNADDRSATISMFNGPKGLEFRAVAVMGCDDEEKRAPRAEKL